MKSSRSLTPAQEEVLSAVRSLRHEEEGPIRTKWVREETGKDSSTTSDLLSSLVEEEAVVRVRKGWYDLPEHAGTELREIPADPFVSIPLLSIQLSPESGVLALQEEIRSYASYDREQIHRETGVDPGRLAILLISGNGMEPTLCPGNKALIACHDRIASGLDRGEEVRDEGARSEGLLPEEISLEETSSETVHYGSRPLRDGSIYLFQNARRGVIIKRLWWEDGNRMRLESDNSHGSEIHVEPTGGEDWVVLGRIVRVEKDL